MLGIVVGLFIDRWLLRAVLLPYALAHGYR